MTKSEIIKQLEEDKELLKLVIADMGNTITELQESVSKQKEITSYLYHDTSYEAIRLKDRKIELLELEIESLENALYYRDKINGIDK